MMKKILLLSVLFLMSYNAFAQDKIKIRVTKQDSTNTYGINKFYFVHQLFANAFFMTDLYKQLDINEMLNIINTALYRTDKENLVGVLIKQKEGPKATLIFSIYENTKIGTVLVLRTNFHVKERIFTKKPDEKNSLVRWYFIKGEKLVYRNDLYSEETEKKIKVEAPHKLIGYYLFDDNFENDSKVLGLIYEILNNKNSDKTEVLYAKLYLGEFYLLNNEIDKAQKEIVELKEYFEKFKDNGIKSEYSWIINMAETEFELMKRMNK